jgi:hypothetical protein
MVKKYPIKFTLESGTHVVVNKNSENTYDFSLTPPEGANRHFTYVEDDRPKAEVDESLDFEQLDAVRTFWLLNEDIV